jgi:Kelch motif
MNHVLTHARRTGLAAAALTLSLLLAGCGLLSGRDDKPKPTGPPDTSAAAGSTSGRVPAAELKPGLWKKLDKAPGTFESSGVTVFEDKVWIAGGLDESRAPTRNVWVFDPSDGPDGGWKAGPKLPGVLTHTVLARNGDRLLLAGGFRFDSGKTAVDTVLQLDESGTRWEPGPKLPIRVGAAAAAWDGKRVVLAGGVTSDESVSDAVYVLEGGKWRELDDRLSQGREGLAADSDGKGKVWFMAGEQATEGKKIPYGNIDVVSGDSVTEAGEVPIARGAVAGFWLPPSTACVVGGRNDAGKPVGAVDCVDADGNQLSLPSMEVGRLGMVAAVLDNKLFVFGGLTRDRLASDLVDVLPLTG